MNDQLGHAFPLQSLERTPSLLPPLDHCLLSSTTHSKSQTSTWNIFTRSNSTIMAAWVFTREHSIQLSANINESGNTPTYLPPPVYAQKDSFVKDTSQLQVYGLSKLRRSISKDMPQTLVGPHSGCGKIAQRLSYPSAKGFLWNCV